VLTNHHPSFLKYWGSIEKRKKVQEVLGGLAVKSGPGEGSEKRG